jgi:hypothetical protein
MECIVQSVSEVNNMKQIILLVLVYVVCMLMFTGILTYAIIHLWPIVWASILQGTTEITQAITAGQLAH